MGFNTQPPEGGWAFDKTKCLRFFWFQHTAARRRLANLYDGAFIQYRFQHTAARRRLGHLPQQGLLFLSVSTHSRPKAAGH